MFHLHHKQVLTIHTSVLVFHYKQINLRPWAKPVSHTPDTPLSVSSQIFSQVDIHLFCRVNNEAYLQAIFLSTAILNNCCNNNQFFVALIIFRCTFQKEKKNIYIYIYIYIFQLELNASAADGYRIFHYIDLSVIKTFTFFQRDAQKWEMIACKKLSLTMVQSKLDNFGTKRQERKITLLWYTQYHTHLSQPSCQKKTDQPKVKAIVLKNCLK